MEAEDRSKGGATPGPLAAEESAFGAHRGSLIPERVVLVSVDFSARQRSSRTAAVAARPVPASDDEAGSSPAASASFSSVNQSARAQAAPDLSAEESLAEFRELVTSAGAVVAAELLQRRPRPDPATLIGSGKVEEIAAVAAFTNADLVLFDHDLSPRNYATLKPRCPAASSIARSSSSTSLPATHALARASSRSS